MLKIKKVKEGEFLVKKIGKYSIFLTRVDSLYQGVYNYEIKVCDDFIAYWYSRTGWDRLPDNKRVREFCEKILPILDLFRDSRKKEGFFYNTTDYYNKYCMYSSVSGESVYIIDLTEEKSGEITIYKRKLNQRRYINSPFGTIKTEDCLRVNL